MKRIAIMCSLLLLATCGVLMLVEASDTQVAADAFTRVSCSTSCGNGQGLGSNWETADNTLTPDPTGAGGSVVINPMGVTYLYENALWTANSFSADQYSEATPYRTIIASNVTGVVARANVSSAGTGGSYLCVDDGGNDTTVALELYVVTSGGTYTELGSIQGSTTDATSLRVAAQGSLITCSWTMEGTEQQIQVSDATWSSGRAGVYGDSGQGGMLQSWSGGNITGGRKPRSGTTWASLLVPTAYAQTAQSLYLMPWQTVTQTLKSGKTRTYQAPKYCAASFQALNSGTQALVLCPTKINQSDAIAVPTDATIDNASSGVTACAGQTWRQCVHSLTGVGGTIALGGLTF
jgi:hypothetical protein